MSEQENPNPSGKARRVRSPAYPALGLKEAIEKARMLYQQFDRHPASIQLISETWGYAKQGSTGPLYAAALRRYGLLEKVETAKNTEDLKLTPNALKILLAPDQSGDEMLSLLKQAALKPKIFAELWIHYQGNLPSDNVIQYYLLTEKGFNRDSVTYLIKIFRETIALANLGANDKILEDDVPECDSGVDNGSNGMTSATQDAKEQKPNPPLHPTASNFGMIEIPVPLPSGVLAYYRVPQKMSEEDFAFYTSLIGHYKKGLTGTDGPSRAL